MKARPRLHYHTDCDFFAGCENMVANFLNDERIYRDFEVSFSYRGSERYNTGLRDRVKTDIRGECYAILPGNAFSKWAADMPGAVYGAVRAAGYLLLARYWILAWNVFVLYRAWRSRGINLLHINNGNYPGAPSCQSAAIAARLAGIPHVVMVVNNIAIPSRYLRWPLDFFLDRLVARCVSLFITGSRSARRALIAELTLPESRVTTLHNGIAARKTSEVALQTRCRLGVAEDALVFGMVALMERRKGHRVLLEAVAALRDLLPSAEMPFVLIEGDGGERDELEDLAARLAISPWVRFVGAERNVFDFMQSLDVLVLPSIAHEDFPNVVLEAMSLGKPVVASRLAGTPEQVDDGATGCLFEPGNSSELVQKLMMFVRDRDLVASMGARAHTRFQERFTAQAAVSRYLELYWERLNRGRN